MQPGQSAQSVSRHRQGIRAESHHHHLPPFVMIGSAMSVELHRNYLPRQFQQGHPLQELIENAREHQMHNARFRVPGAEHQIIHIILGKFIHDGYCARQHFPIRNACDYINVVKSAGATLSGNVLVEVAELIARKVASTWALRCDSWCRAGGCNSRTT